MKPTLVDNCEHYSYQTHNCTKCGRGLPDVCAEFEEMRNAAKAFHEQNEVLRNKDSSRTVGSGDDVTDDTVASVDTPAVPKPRGRQRAGTASPKRVAQ